MKLARRLIAAPLLALLLLTSLVAAQSSETAGPDYDRWRSLAQRAESVIDADRASDVAMEQMRAELVTYRQQFLSARDANSARISTLQSQLNALGPTPEDGSETPEIAASRAELTEALARLRAPVLAAEAAYNQANGLVGEVDRILRERQTNELLSLGPSPLNPALWSQAVSEVDRAVQGLVNETRAAWRNPVQRAEMRADLPLFFVLLAVASILLIRGRRWAEMAGNYLRRLGGRGSGVWTFLTSLGRIFLPMLGLLALIEAIFMLRLLGARSTLLLDSVPVWAAILLIVRWLCERLFAKHDDVALIPASRERRAEARLYGTLLALIVVLRDAWAQLVQIENLSAATSAVVALPALAVAGLILFRLGQILGQISTQSDGEAGEEGKPVGVLRLVRYAGRASMVVAFVAPAMAAVGYGAAGNAMMFPTIMTLGLYGVVLVLQRFFADVYALATGQGVEGRDSLAAMLIGFALIVGSLPFLALLWGARVSDLTELWSRFLEGFTFGDTRISPTDFMAFAIIFTIGFAATRMTQAALRTNLLPKTRIDPGGQTAIVSGLGYVGIFLAALLAITGAGIDLSSLAFVAGALSLGIGFGLQNIVQNFVSGIILLIERPISEGDWIEVGGRQGYVRDISVRSTRIETFDRSDVIIPNADFVSGTVTNFTRGNTVGRVIVPVGVAYGTDTRRVEKILGEIAVMHPMVITTPPPSVVFQGFGADSLDFEIRAILRDVNWMLSVKSEMNHEIARRFVEEGIEIPFAQRDVWLRNPEVLTGGAASAPAQEPKTGPAPDPEEKIA